MPQKYSIFDQWKQNPRYPADNVPVGGAVYQARSYTRRTKTQLADADQSMKNNRINQVGGPCSRFRKQVEETR